MADNPLPIWDGTADSEENYIRTKLGTEAFTSQSGASLFTQLKDMGFTIGEGSFYDIRRDVLQIAKHQEQTSVLSGDIPIPQNYIDYVPTWNLSSNYMYQQKYYYTIGDDPTLYEGFYTTISNKRLTKDELLDISGLGLLELAYEREGTQLTILGIELLHVYAKNR
jgi:hypothetical protein